MPTYLSSYLVPRNGQQWFVVEDIYLRGGFKVVADTVARDALHSSTKKVGSFVFTSSDGKLWQYQVDGSWVEFSLNPKSKNPVYTHKQTEASAVWTIEHGKNSDLFTYSVFDGLRRSVIPHEVTATDLNSITIEFGIPLDGHVTFVFDLS